MSRTLVRSGIAVFGLAALIAQTPPASAQHEVEALSERLRSSHRVDRVAAAAVTTLEPEGLEAFGPLLVGAMEDDDDWLVRSVAARSLGVLRFRHALPALVRATRDPQPEVRAAAIRSLAELSEPIVFVTIVHGLRDDAPIVRVQTARMLGELGNDDAAAHLGQCLRAGAGVARAACARALARLGTSAALGELARFAADPTMDGEERRRAVETIVGASSGERAGALVQLISASDVEIRRRSIVVLGELGDARALPALEQRFRGYLRDGVHFDHEPSGELRQLLRRAIQRIESRATVEAPSE